MCQAGRAAGHRSASLDVPARRQVWSCSGPRLPGRLTSFGECSARSMLVRGQVAGAELHDSICGELGATLTATDDGPALATVGNAGVVWFVLQPAT